MGIDMATQLECLLRILLAGICGGVIGHERESHMKMAGIRTHFIVAIASALLMVVSKYGFYDMLGTAGVKLDPSRVASGIVTAIGFLGTGIIFVRNRSVSGLTTSAGIWATVGVGMAVGAGMYFIGIIVAAIIVVVLKVLGKRTKLIKSMHTEQITLLLRKGEELDKIVSEIFSDMEVEIINILAKRQDADSMEIKMTIQYQSQEMRGDIAKAFTEHPHIQAIER